MNELDQQSLSDREPGMSIVEKLVNVLTAPTQVFERIRDSVSREDWLVPLIVVFVVAGTVSVIQAPYTTKVAIQMMEAQKEKLLDRGLSEEQQKNIEQRFEEQVEKQQGYATPPGRYYRPVIRTVFYLGLITLILAGLYYFGGNVVLGSETSFEKVLTVVALPQMVTVVQQIYNGAFSVMAQSAEVPASLAALLPYGAADIISVESYQRAMFTLLSQVNVFTVWRLVLFTIGFQVIYKVSRGKAIGVIFGYWILWVLLLTAGTFVSSGMFG